MKFRDVVNKDYESRGINKLKVLEFIEKIVFDKSYSAVFYYRLAIYLKEKKMPFLNYIFRVSSRYILSKLKKSPGIEFPSKEIGWGLLLPHPHDIVLGKGAIIGDNVTIFNGVTLGLKSDPILYCGAKYGQNSKRYYPQIENGVFIYTGAKIIGDVRIGENCIIGANAVVLTSFESNSVIAGVPAKLIKRVK